MKIRYLLIICIFLISVSVFAQKQKPNVILVMSDDQGYGEFSFNGNPVIKTPNIDKLAADGVVFTNFHVSPMCTPTRGELLTGLDAFRNGAINVSSGRTLLRTEVKTIANIFSEAGYQTGIFGKWHLGDNYPYRPEDRGFDETIWFPSSHINSLPDTWDNDYFDDTFIHNGQKEKYIGYCTDIFFNQAMYWIQKKSEEGSPFFTYLPLNASHWPHFVPEKYREVVRNQIKSNPEIVSHLSEEKLEDLISFLAMGANIDENMGKLDKFLKESGLYKNTIVVFLTDNGSTMGPDYYNAGMRGGKTTLWEGGHRVPCIISTPGFSGTQIGTINELCQVQDLLPTICSMAGINNVPDNLNGVDLSSLIKGETSHLEDRMLVINYSRMPTFKVNYTNENPAIPQKDGAGVLWKNWRLLENRELYNIADDPHQDKDVSSEYPEIVSKMRAHLDKWWNGVKDDVYEIQKVTIGNDAENPMLLSACEWLDVFVDQQIQVRRGVVRNGVWHVIVDQAGEYEFELRRWPKESGYALNDSLPSLKVTDGTFVKGVAFPISSAGIKIGNQEKWKTGYDKSAIFKFHLEKGENTIQTWFNNKNNIEIAGAYYLYVQRKQDI